jgi:hypothetical protein
MRVAGNAACIGEMRHGDRASDGIPERRGCLKNLEVDGKILLKQISKK